MRRKTALAGVLVVALAPLLQQPALAQETCARVVMFALPTVTWEEIAEREPPHLLALADRGALGSISVRTNSSRTTYASGFATIGAGTRMDVPPGAGLVADGISEGFSSVTVGGLDRIEDLAAEQGYSSARPGALGEALEGSEEVGEHAAVGNADPGSDPPSPAVSVSHVALAAMDAEGEVPRAAIGEDLLREDASAPYGVRTDEGAIEAAVDEVLDERCSVVIVDHGDLIRVDRAAASGLELEGDAREEALMAADDLLGHVLARLDLDRDLLLVASTASPLAVDEVHFGVALAAGPGFPAGATMSSPSTRRAGMVTLPDIAPTMLAHLGIPRPGSMLGRAWHADGLQQGDRIATAVDLDRESVFIDAIRTPVSTAFVLFQLLVYAATIWVLSRRERGRGEGRGFQRVLQSAALFLAAFPLSTYAAGVVQGHPIGAGGYTALLVGLTLLIVGLASTATGDPLQRLLIVVGATFTVLVLDLVFGAPLQLNTVFSYSPIVAGRFAGIGNIGFAILAASSLLTGALIVHVLGDSGRALAAVAFLFALTVVVDGAPQFGSDVGGAIALVPGLAISWLLIAGRRPSWKAVALALLGGLVVLGGFLALDLARPEESRTHLARLFEDVRSGGGQVFKDAITRKVRTNLRVLGSTIWTFVVPPALGLLAWLLLRPRWQWLSRTFPKVRAGLLSGLVMAVLGYAVNDSGIVIPAMMFSYLVPVAVLAHLSHQADQQEGA